MPERAPYWPWLMRLIELAAVAQVDGLVIGVEGESDRHRAPSFQRAGFSERPARTLATLARHVGSSQSQGALDRG